MLPHRDADHLDASRRVKSCDSTPELPKHASASGLDWIRTRGWTSAKGDTASEAAALRTIDAATAGLASTPTGRQLRDRRRAGLPRTHRCGRWQDRVGCRVAPLLRDQRAGDRRRRRHVPASDVEQPVARHDRRRRIGVQADLAIVRDLDGQHPEPVGAPTALALASLGLMVFALFYLLSLPAHREAGRVFRTVVDLSVKKLDDWTSETPAPLGNSAEGRIASRKRYLNSLK